MNSLQSNSFYRNTLILLIFSCSLLLSGCGFHLKHHNGLVEKFPEIYIQTSDPKGELTRLVKLRLRGANIKILTESSPDVAILNLKSERQTDRTVALYSNAQNAEKEIGYSMTYSLKLPNYTPQDFTVNIYRDFLDNPSQALAKSRESELLTKEVRGIAADHIMATMLSMNDGTKE